MAWTFLVPPSPSPSHTPSTHYLCPHWPLLIDFCFTEHAELFILEVLQVLILLSKRSPPSLTNFIKQTPSHLFSYVFYLLPQRCSPVYLYGCHVHLCRLYPTKGHPTKGQESSRSWILALSAPHPLCSTFREDAILIGTKAHNGPTMALPTT